MESGLFLDVVVRKSAAIFELLSSKDQALLVRRNAFLILNLVLDVVNGVGRLNLKCNRLACESLHEDLHTTTETKDKVKSGLLLDVVVGKSSAILELFTREDKTLLVGRDTLLVLNLVLDIINSVGRLDFQSNGLASQGLDEDLHTTTETEHEMESRLLLNVVVRKGAPILELLASEDQALLVGRDTVQSNQ